MAYAKPYLTIPQQIALLQSRGMEITDLGRAEQALQRIGYYRLSGYWYPFRIPLRDGNNNILITDDFRPHTNLQTVVDLYVFDKKLRLLFMDAFERIEIALRVQISLLLGKRSPLAHRGGALLHGNFAKKRDPATGLSRHDEWLSRTDAAFRESRAEFAWHFRNKYGGEHPPIWIACEVWDFGATSALFGGMTKADQQAVAAQYEIGSFQVMDSWLRCLNFARNCCAHHGRFWNRPLVIRPSWPSAVDAPKLAHILQLPKAQTRTYAVACLTKHMLDLINPASSWAERLKALCDSFPDDPVISLTAAGIPARWKTLPLWA